MLSSSYDRLVGYHMQNKIEWRKTEASGWAILGFSPAHRKYHVVRFHPLSIEISIRK